MKYNRITKVNSRILVALASSQLGSLPIIHPDPDRFKGGPLTPRGRAPDQAWTDFRLLALCCWSQSGRAGNLAVTAGFFWAGPGRAGPGLSLDHLSGPSLLIVIVHYTTINGGMFTLHECKKPSISNKWC